MARLELRFGMTQPGEFELLATTFAYPTPPQIKQTIRARMVSSSLEIGTFNWTAAVMATCLLLLRYRSQENNGEGPVSLIGAENSPANSLDCALSKRPLWILDMFGIDSHGASVGQKLFWRINSNRKRPGAVFVGVNPRILAWSDITVYVDGKILSSAKEICAVADSIERNSWKGGQGVVGSALQHLGLSRVGRDGSVGVA